MPDRGESVPPRFAFTPEQLELRAVVRKALAQHSSSDDLSSAMNSENGHDAKLWALLAGQLGVAGIGIPAELGGSGAGHVELGLVMEEAGRALLCSPFLATVVLGARTFLASGDLEQQQAVLPRIAAGELTAALALADGDSTCDPPAGRAVARPGDGAWVLDGTKLFVVDGASADLLVVRAAVAPEDGDGASGLFVVEAGVPGLCRTPMRTLDLTRRQARIDLDGCPATLLVGPADCARVVEHVEVAGRAALAAEQVGGAERCLEMSVEYAKVREQFGQPIGSFQAIKHRCAEMFVEVELARSTAYNALWELDEAGGGVHGPVEDHQSVHNAMLAASMAKAACSDAYVFAATENIQVHGGIGFSWEHPAHLYFRRARSSAVMLGAADFHRDLVARRLGLG